MQTLQNDLDNLDRMVDGGSAKDEIRSQVRLMSREVAALETDYSRLAQDHAKAIAELQVEYRKRIADLEAANAKLKTETDRRGSEDAKMCWT